MGGRKENGENVVLQTLCTDLFTIILPHAPAADGLSTTVQWYWLLSWQ
jgi:hypothetical protein